MNSNRRLLIWFALPMILIAVVLGTTVFMGENGYISYEAER